MQSRFSNLLQAFFLCRSADTILPHRTQFHTVAVATSIIPAAHSTVNSCKYVFGLTHVLRSCGKQCNADESGHFQAGRFDTFLRQTFGFFPSAKGRMKIRLIFQVQQNIKWDKLKYSSFHSLEFLSGISFSAGRQTAQDLFSLFAKSPIDNQAFPAYN